jgi:alpha-ribazole phosphatase
MSQADIDRTFTCVAWRHPKPIGAPGRCIGHTDLPVDRRKAKRLAHRIRHAARRHGWPRVIHTSPLQRCARVGRQLRNWGWRHHVDPSLLEMHFGAWDGQAWQAITAADVDAWCADFLHAPPGEGESLHAMFERVAQGARKLASAAPASAPCLIVAHGGWMQVARWLAGGEPLPTDPAQWRGAPVYGECWQLEWVLSAPGAQAP